MTMTYFTDEWAVVGAIDPDSTANSPATTVLTDAIDMSDYDQVAFILSTGNFSTAAGTVDFTVTQATTSGGTYKAVTSASATQLTGSPTDDDKQVIITVDQTALDMDNNFRFVKGQIVTGGTGTIDVSCIALGRAKHKPASDSDLSSVDEIVNV